MTKGDTSTHIRPRLPVPQRPRRLLLVLAPEGSYSFDLPETGRLVIGRERGADICVPEKSISRRHAELILSPESVVLRDLGSQNGTLVRGVSIRADYPLAVGEAIELGGAVAFLQDSRALLDGRPSGGHAAWNEKLQKACAEARWSAGSFAVLMVEMGSESTEAVRLLRSVLRPEDLLEEYGPRELEILLPEANADAADAVATRIKDGLLAGGLQARVGAAVYRRDGTSPDELITAARKAVRAVAGIAPLPEAVHQPVVASAAMRKLYEMVDQIADSTLPVLLNGETGVGKEVLAEAIHRRSPRRNRPMVRLNCAALPENLLEAELFGYERGAFTGAVRAKPGLFEHAHGGTLLLDEVGELAMELQAKLLRVLEDKLIRRVGALQPVQVDVRIIASTNRDLARMVQAQRFREDLYYRLSGVTLHIPPLRERREEIVPLVRTFADLFAKEQHRAVPAIGPEAERWLLAYGWPGNIRQLRLLVERAVLLCRSAELGVAQLADWVGPTSFTAASAPSALPATEAITAAATHGAKAPSAPMKEELAALERERILQALASTGHNQTRAAAMLEMPRRTFLDKLDRYGIDRPRKSKRSLTGEDEDA